MQSAHPKESINPTNAGTEQDTKNSKTLTAIGNNVVLLLLPLLLWFEFAPSTHFAPTADGRERERERAGTPCIETPSLGTSGFRTAALHRANSTGTTREIRVTLNGPTSERSSLPSGSLIGTTDCSSEAFDFATHELLGLFVGTEPTSKHSSSSRRKERSHL